MIKRVQTKINMNEDNTGYKGCVNLINQACCRDRKHGELEREIRGFLKQEKIGENITSQQSRNENNQQQMGLHCKLRALGRYHDRYREKATHLVRLTTNFQRKRGMDTTLSNKRCRLKISWYEGIR